MIAYCGLDCEACPIRQATMATDREVRRRMRIEIARQCTRHYGMLMKPEDVTDCDGCSSGSGRLFQGCLDCLIRKCAIERKLDSCSRCPDYACGTLLKHFDTDPVSRTRLEALRHPNGGVPHRPSGQGGGC